jgi:beta-lactamase superfamily II metal-dependent hydrolase
MPTGRNITGLVCVASVCVICLWLSGCISEQAGPVVYESHFTLWQLSSNTHSQMMSYVLQTQNGQLVVIDGGTAGDACYLRGFLGALGNDVEAWFISHPHPDHVDALTKILKQPGDLRINAIYGSLPQERWVEEYEPEYLESLTEMNRALRESSQEVAEVIAGEVIKIDGIRIEVLSAKNPEITNNAINNSSVVLKVSDTHKSVLFTGDLGVEGGKKLLDSPYGKLLKADYVQMAHHGQNGVDESFYQAVQPRYCLWPTPEWLWNNDSGSGPNSGPWKTMEVREWMDMLGVTKHYVSALGLYKIGP